MDESGDDGFPKYSSELFVLTGIYMPIEKWHSTYARLHDLRIILKTKYDYPIKEEIHLKDFLLDKGFSHGKYNKTQRKELLTDIVCFYKELLVKVLLVAIDKQNIDPAANYNVLNQALTYLIQRLENNMKRNYSGSLYLIISDEGRLPPMRRTSRKIQRYNPIPSKYSSIHYRKEIEHMVEDILGKDSRESYLLQMADSISYITHLYVTSTLSNPTIKWPNRMDGVLNKEDVWKLLNDLKPIINLNATNANEFGIVYYPKSKSHP